MTAEFGALLVGAQHDRKRVPADDRAKLVLDRAIARQRRLPVRRNRVAVGRRQRLLYPEAFAARGVNNCIDDELGSFIAAMTADCR